MESQGYFSELANFKYRPRKLICSAFPYETGTKRAAARPI